MLRFCYQCKYVLVILSVDIRNANVVNAKGEVTVRNVGVGDSVVSVNMFRYA